MQCRLFVSVGRACYPREMLGKMSRKTRSSLIAKAIGVIVLVATSLCFWLYPNATFEFFVKAAFYAGLCLFGSVARASMPFRIFLFVCATILIGVPLLGALYMLAPEYFAPAYAIGGTLTVMLFLRSERLTREQKAAIAFLLARAVGALSLVIAVTPMTVRAGLGGMLAIWILYGVLAVWRVLHGKSPAGAIFRMTPDPWRWSRDKNGNWRA
jgi:hypothetical protein